MKKVKNCTWDCEEYIHNRIGQEELRHSDFEFYLISDEEDHSSSLFHKPEPAECSITKSVRICNCAII
jgi:hypothetical protein